VTEYSGHSDCKATVLTYERLLTEHRLVLLLSLEN